MKKPIIEQYQYNPWKSARCPSNSQTDLNDRIQRAEICEHYKLPEV